MGASLTRGLWSVVVTCTGYYWSTEEQRINDVLDLYELTILTSDNLRTMSRRLVTMDTAGHYSCSVYLYYLSVVE